VRRGTKLAGSQLERLATAAQGGKDVELVGLKCVVDERCRAPVVEDVSFDVAGQVSDTISREEGAVKQAALEIGRKVVNRAVDRF